MMAPLRGYRSSSSTDVSSRTAATRSCISALRVHSPSSSERSTGICKGRLRTVTLPKTLPRHPTRVAAARDGRELEVKQKRVPLHQVGTPRLALEPVVLEHDAMPRHEPRSRRSPSHRVRSAGSRPIPSVGTENRSQGPAFDCHPFTSTVGDTIIRQHPRRLRYTPAIQSKSEDPK